MEFYKLNELNEEDVKKRKIIKWDITTEERRANSEALYRFFTSLGLDDEDTIEIYLDEDSKKSKGNTFHGALEPLKVIEFKEKLISDIKVKMGNPFTSETFDKYLKTENEKGYVIYFSVNGSREKEKRRFTVQFMDFDTGKETKYFKTKDEAENYAGEFEGRSHIKKISVKPQNKKGTSEVLRYGVTVYFTDEYISEKKTDFLDRYDEILKDATIVETKNGFHIYIKSIGIKDDATYQIIQEGLIRRFRTDSSVTDASRVSRVPFFAHTKDPSNPFFVKVIQYSSDKVFSKEDFRTEFGLTFEEEKIKENFSESVKRTKKGIETKTVKTVTSTNLEMKEEFDLPFSNSKLSFIEFVEEIKKFPLNSFYKNPELEPDNSFCCHFHDDKKPSAATFEMYDGTHVYYCHSDSCKQQRTVFDMFMETFNLGFFEAVRQLAKRSNVKLVLTEYQADKLQEISLNLMSIRLHLDASDVTSSESPILYKFFNRNMNLILTFLNSQILSYPLKEEWSHNNMPIFFASTDFLAKKLNLRASNLAKDINMLVLLGFLIKLHHAEVPKTLYKRIDEGKSTINYYCLPMFEDVVADAEKKIQHMKKIKFKRTAISFEYIAVSFGLDEARRVFPNDFKEPERQASKKVTNRKIRKKTEDVHRFLFDYIAKAISKKGFVKEETVFKKVAAEPFAIYSKKESKTIERTLLENELKAIYNLFKPWFVQQGYERIRLNNKLCDELGIPKKPKRGEQIHIWRKQK